MTDSEEIRKNQEDEWGEKPLHGPTGEDLNQLMFEVMDDIPVGSERSSFKDTKDNQLAWNRLKLQLEDMEKRGVVAAPINW